VKWWILSAVLLVPAGLIAGGLLLNRPPWSDPPGLWARLHLYLTTHVAETRKGHPRPELRPLVVALPPEAAKSRVVEAMQALGWRRVTAADDAVTAEVVTALLRFVDDVAVTLEPEGEGVAVQVRAASRVGRGDLAANTRHVLDLYAELRRRAGSAVVR
jgi:uncharacterized protein (DUF1499 family)